MRWLSITAAWNTKFVLSFSEPTSMSKSVISDLIRNKWNYDGILITDNFSMIAVYKSKKGMQNGSIEALNSGVDLILVSYDPDHYPIMNTLLNALDSGKLDINLLYKSRQRLTKAALHCNN